MSEPAPKRPRRPDSKQMWEEQDRRAPARERDNLRDRRDDRDRDRQRDDDRDRNRRYRSRSPRDSRASGRDRDRDRGDRRGGRDDRGGRERGRDERDTRRAGGDRARNSEYTLNGQSALVWRGISNVLGDEGRETRDKLPERSRSPRRRRTRSRSPRPGKDREGRRNEGRSGDKGRLPIPDEDPTKSRTATPPLSFKVHSSAMSSAESGPGGNTGQDHDRMDIEADGKSYSKMRDTIEDDGIEEDEEIIVEDDGLDDMQAMMGFGGFGTTHQKKVLGNDIYAVRKEKKTEYRQYMNRVGGFNRPLSPGR